jgi:hypothetical protein
MKNKALLKKIVQEFDEAMDILREDMREFKQDIVTLASAISAASAAKALEQAGVGVDGPSPGAPAGGRAGAPRHAKGPSRGAATGAGGPGRASRAGTGGNAPVAGRSTAVQGGSGRGPGAGSGRGAGGTGGGTPGGRKATAARCGAKHPASARPCIRPVGHSGMHYIGTRGPRFKG